MAWVALWQAFRQTRKCSFLMISPKLLDFSRFFLLIFSPLGTADFCCYLSFQVMAILCCVAKNSLRGTTALFLAMLLFSIIPGHFKFYSRLYYRTALFPAICLLFAGYSLPSKQLSFVCCCLAQPSENGTTW